MEDADPLLAPQQRSLRSYNRLKKSLGRGVSNTVLANALRELESDGLILRREYLEVPVRVEYQATRRCEQLIPILDALGNWSIAL